MIDDDIDSHYYTCDRCRHMFLIKSLIDDFCNSPDFLSEIKDFCDYILQRDYPEVFHKKKDIFHNGSNLDK